MSNAFAILTRRLDILNTFEYTRFDYEELSESIMLQVYSRTLPTKQVIIDAKVWQLRIDKIRNRLTDAATTFFEYRDTTTYEYDDVGGPWQTLKTIKLPIGDQERAPFVQMIEREIEAYELLISTINEYLKQTAEAEPHNLNSPDIPDDPALNEKHTLGMRQGKNQPTGRLATFELSYNDISLVAPLHDKLKEADYLPEDSEIEQFKLIFNKAAIPIEKTKWQGTQQELSYLISQLLIRHIIKETKSGQQWEIGRACFQHETSLRHLHNPGEISKRRRDKLNKLLDAFQKQLPAQSGSSI